MDGKVGIIGGGLMGCGIAQLSLSHGHEVVVVETQDEQRDAVSGKIAAGLARARPSRDQASIDEQLARLTVGAELSTVVDCKLIIEAATENLELKQELFVQLEEIASTGALLTSNTSTFSISAISASMQKPGRLVGMHFFNPAPRMQLVEIISGLETASSWVQQARQWAKGWGKTVVHSASTPGFIVNRIARPYYSDALTLLEEKCSSPDNLDAVLTGSGMFPLGPFALIDLIGLDNNYRSTQSIYEAFSQDKRYRPSYLQREYIDAGRLGRKSGRGFYAYDSGNSSAAPEFHPPAKHEIKRLTAHCKTGSVLLQLANKLGVAFEHKTETDERKQRLDIDGIPLYLSAGLFCAQLGESARPVGMLDWIIDLGTVTTVAIAVNSHSDAGHKEQFASLFQQLGIQVVFVADTAGMVVHRLLCLLINEALQAVMQEVASDEDCDLAMRYGMNLKRQPLELAKELGYTRVWRSLTCLLATLGEDKFRPSPELTRRTKA